MYTYYTVYYKEAYGKLEHSYFNDKQKALEFAKNYLFTFVEEHMHNTIYSKFPDTDAEELQYLLTSRRKK